MYAGVHRADSETKMNENPNYTTTTTVSFLRTCPSGQHSLETKDIITAQDR